MNDEDKVAVFRAELYMKSIAEMRPYIETATEEAVTAHLAAREALSTLTRVANELKRLDILTDEETGVHAKGLIETLSVDSLIQKYESESFVYFIEADDYIKIGYSRDPIGRLSQIRKRHGVKLPDGLDPSRARILAVEQGTQSHERRLHDRFAEHRVAGEWFEKNDRLTHYIKSITTPTETK